MESIKKTTLVLGLIATVMTFMQASTARWAGDFFSEPALLHGGNTGRYIAVFFLIAAIITLLKPIISVALFSATGMVAIVSGILMDYYDIIFWGSFSLIMAYLSYLAHKETEYDDEDEEIFEDDFTEKKDDNEEKSYKDYFTEREMLLNRRSKHYIL